MDKHLNKSDIVKPVDEVEEWEHRRENDSRPAVDGVYIRQVWDFNLKLGRSPPQTAAFHLSGPVQGVAAGGARADPAALLPVLNVRWCRAVQLHHGLRVPNVRHAGGDLASRHFVVDLQGG